MAYRKDLDTTTNPQLHKKLRREELARQEGSCPRCPPHGGENAGMSRKIGRNWKKKRKTKYKLRS